MVLRVGASGHCRLEYEDDGLLIRLAPVGKGEENPCTEQKIALSAANT